MTTIHTAIGRITHRMHLTPRDWAIIESLRDLARAYGLDATGRWTVVENDFHGGDVISTHRSPLAAIRAARSRNCGHDDECSCGGARVELPAD